MGRQRDRTGIAGFFEDLENSSDDKQMVVEAKPTAPPKQEKRKQLPPKEDSKEKPARSDNKSDEGAPRRISPTGRPPGKKSGDGPHRTRTTLWISDELMEAYRERMWQEHCRLGELIERALVEYRNHNWGDTDN